MTKEEMELSQMLGDVWNKYITLPVEHPMEKQEFCTAIHNCQYIIMSRCGQRHVNKEYKLDQIGE